MRPPAAPPISTEANASTRASTEGSCDSGSDRRGPVGGRGGDHGQMLGARRAAARVGGRRPVGGATRVGWIHPCPRKVKHRRVAPIREVSGDQARRPDADRRASTRIAAAAEAAGHPAGRGTPRRVATAWSRPLIARWRTAPVELLEVETGRRPVLDPDLEVLTDLYGIPTTSLIPERSAPGDRPGRGRLGVGHAQVVPRR